MIRRKAMLAALAMIPVMAVVFRYMTTHFSPLNGYFAAFSIYWLGFLLPASLMILGPAQALKMLRPRWPGWPGFLMTAGPPLAVGAMIATHPVPLPLAILAITLLAALVNGTLEELFWRGALFDTNKTPDWPVLLAALLVFALWHVAILASRGIAYTGGPVALVGGAFALGAIWSLTRRTSGTAGFGAVGHVLTNAVAFTQLVQQNYPAPG